MMWGGEGVCVLVCMRIDMHTHIYEYQNNHPQYRWNHLHLPKVNEQNDVQAAKTPCPQIGGARRLT